MRQRIVERLKEASRTSALDAARWRDLRGRLGDIAISTIDAFCLALLREFPLEADVDPAFELADETEMPRLVEEALDRSLRICRAMARDDDDVALVFAQLGERRLRLGLAALLESPAGGAGAAAPLPRRWAARSDGGRRRAAPRRRGSASSLRICLEVSSRSSGRGPMGHPQFALLAADIAALAARP